MNFDTFKLLMMEYVKANKIPAIKFAENSSLKDAFRSICGNGTDCSPAITDEAALGAYIDQIAASQNNELTKGMAFAELDKLIDICANKINDSMAILRSLKDEVTIVAGDINNKLNDSLARDPVMSAYMQKTTLQTEYSVVSWQDILLLSPERVIVRAINQLTGQQDVDSCNRNTLLLAIQRLPFVNKSVSTGVYADLALSPENRKKMIDTIQATFCQPGITSAVLVEDVAIAVDIITNAGKARRFMDSVVKNVSGQMPSIDCCIVLLKYIRILQPICNALRQGTFELDEVGTNSMLANIKAVQQYLEVAAYYLIIHRYSSFRDGLVLSNLMLNPDNYEDFKSKGGDTIMIAHHLAARYKNVKLPIPGVTGDSILTTASAIKAAVDRDMVTAGQRATIAKNDATLGAMKHVLTEYIIKFKAAHPGMLITVDADVISYLANQTVIKGISIEDTVYDMLINLSYAGSFVQTIYQRLGSAYFKGLAATATISEHDARMIEGNVFIDLITTFLIDRFVVANG